MRNARKLREDRGLSLGAVYRATGIDAARLSKFELERRHLMDYLTMKRLAAFYECEIDDLLADATPEPAAKGATA